MTRPYRRPAQGRTVNDTHPPLDLLPANLVKLIEEKRNLQRAYDEAANEDARLNNIRGGDSLDVLATQEDAAASAAAARAGKPQQVTKARDALAAARDDARRARASLKEALAVVTQEIATARWKWDETGESANRVTDARTKLAKAAQTLDDALAAASLAIAVDDWVKGEFYDDDLRFRILDVMPSLTNIVGGRMAGDSDGFPVDVTEILTNLTDL